MYVHIRTYIVTKLKYFLYLQTVQKEVINLDEMLQREPYSGATALHLCRRGALLRKVTPVIGLPEKEPFQAKMCTSIKMI